MPTSSPHEWHPDDLTSHGMAWEDVASDELSWTGTVRWAPSLDV